MEKGSYRCGKLIPKATQTDEITKLDPNSRLIKKRGYSYILHNKWPGLLKNYNKTASSSFYPAYSCTIYDGKIQGKFVKL